MYAQQLRQQMLTEDISWENRIWEIGHHFVKIEKSI